MPPPPSPASLAHLHDLLTAVALGDEDAFRQLYGLTRARLTRVVESTLRSPELSAEVVQEVYLHVWQHAGTYDPARGSAAGWLRTLAHRRAVDRVRQVEREAERDRRDAAARGWVVDDVSDLGLARVEAARVLQALHQLTGAQREAICLTFLAGHSHPQAAALLRVPLGTLKSRVHTGLAALRRLLPVPSL